MPKLLNLQNSREAMEREFGIIQLRKALPVTHEQQKLGAPRYVTMR